MSKWRPSVEEERWLAIGARLSGKISAEFLATRTGGWKRTGPLARVAFAALGLAAAGCTAGIVGAHTDGLVLTGLILLAAAESLILIGRLFASGIEEALWTVGLLCVGIGLLNPLHSTTDNDWLMLGLAVSTLAGLRLLNPLLTTIAAVTAGAWLCARPLAVTFDARHAAHLTVNLYSLAMALTALALLGLPMRRPSYEQMLGWIVTLLPITGLIWLAGVDPLTHAGGSTEGPRGVYALLAGAVAVTAVVMLFVGLRRRSHAPLMSFMGCCAHLAWQLRGVSGLSLEARLLLWGLLVLVAALLINRYLRSPRHGLTSEPMTDRSGALGLLELAGTSALTEQTAGAAAEPAPAWAPGGGQFGGAGSTGSF